MNSIPFDARQELEQAWKALSKGDRYSARRFAERAAALAPEWEEPWLVLASVASPRASIAYLEQALKRNPLNEHAQRGLRWAKERLNHSGRLPDADGPDTDREVSHQQNTPNERQRSSDAHAQADSPGQKRPDKQTNSIFMENQKGKSARTPMLRESAIAVRRYNFLPVLVFIFCVTLIWAVWPGNASPVLAYLRDSMIISQPTPSLAGAPADVAKPTYTSTPSPTFTPTATLTPTSTPTNTPLPTSTKKPSPTTIPAATEAPSTSPPPVNPGNRGERWIDVDISEQRVYAYEGSTLVASFVVSTGTSRYPTLTGQYSIYLKLRYTDMSGPGYYLPDVPYTMYYYKGYALHGTYWHNNFGTPMSHGCINLSIPDSAWLYDFASIGTIVNIHK